MSDSITITFSDETITISSEPEAVSVQATDEQVTVTAYQGDVTFQAASAVKVAKTAGENLSACKVVWSDGSAVYYGSASEVTQYGKILGFTEHAYLKDEPASIITFGELTNNTWNLTEGKDVYLSTGGDISHSMPSSGFVVCVGRAITATKILVNIGFSIIRA